MELQNIQSETIIPIEESIVDGVYTRIAYAPANCYIIGCAHKKGGSTFLMKGSIRQIDGNDKYEISAPFIFNTEQGTQRVAYTLTDTIYATTHSVKAKTVEEAELEVFEQVPQITRIRNSFKSLLLSLDTTEELIQKEMDSLEVLDEHNELYTIQQSPIHGLGCFTTTYIHSGTCIAMAELDGNRLPTARYINHSDMPNAAFIDYKDSIALVALVDIPEGYEILVNYIKRKNICQE